jgi:nicotinamide-nucleotide amidase
MVTLRYRPHMAPDDPARRPLTRAIVLAVGSELTTGATRDTNSGELAARLADLGVSVGALTALPDDLALVQGAIEAALTSADLVLMTGGLGPTPDDLTREAISGAVGEIPAVDADLAAELRALFERRGLPMPEANLKQAWRIPSAVALANTQGTAPGWWVDRPDGRVIVAMPGPPSEMRPMWLELVLPRLRQRGVGRERAAATWRLTGIGESALVTLIGEDRLRAANPAVATYARPDAVDVRMIAVSDGQGTAIDHLAEVEGALEPLLSPYRFAVGDMSWAATIGARLGGRRVAVVEIGTGGQVGALLGSEPWFAFGETLAPDEPLAHAHRDLRLYASRVREVAGVAIGLAVRARQRGDDTAVSIATDVDGAAHRISRTVFLAGEVGRRRAAVAAATELWRRLGPTESDD